MSREIIDSRRYECLDIDIPIAVNDSVSQPGCSAPCDLRVGVLRFDGDLAGSLPEHGEVPQERGASQRLSVNLLGGSIADQGPDRHGCIAHLTQQQELTLHRAAARRRAPARGCTC